MSNQHDDAGQAQAEARLGRVGLAIGAHLHRGAHTLPPDISERLRFARERAEGAAAAERRRLQAAVAVAAYAVRSGRHAVLAGPPSWWLRMASVLPLALLVAGLVFIQHHHDVEQISAAAEIDSALLADELPPDAYRDPGFGEYLRTVGGTAP